MPGVVALRRKRVTVASVQDIWDVLDEWWRSDPVARRYYSVKLEDGLTITIFHDTIANLWYRQQV